ncbi:MAG TPA: hypothetical protein ACFCUC_06790 [Desulfobacterales bacterium]
MNRQRHFTEFLQECRAAFYLWSIRNQDAVSRQIRIHMWSGVASFLVATLVVPIPLEKALTWLFVLGISLTAGLWVLVERRRSWLLQIRDPELKRAAHRAMVEYLQQKIGEGKTRHPDSCGESGCNRYR